MSRLAYALIASVGLASPALAQSNLKTTTPPANTTGPSTNGPSNGPTTGAGSAAPATTPAPTPSVDKSGFTFLNPTPDANLRGFNADRPTKSNSPITVDAGHWQIETDLFNYQHSNAGGVTTRVYTTLDPVAKLGITNNLDFEVAFGGFNYEQVFAPGQSSSAQQFRGSGDTVLRAKVNLFGNEGGAALALIPYVKVPTAAQGLGNGHTDGGLIAPFSVTVPYGFVVLVEPEVDVITNFSNAGHHFNYAQLLNVSHAIGSTPLTAYAEIYSSLGTDKNIPPVYTFDTAVSWMVKDNLQLDVGANIGLNKASPNLQLYTGIAARW